MLSNIDGTILCAAIEESPKFRRRYLEVKVEEKYDLSKKIIDIYHLNLIDDVYCKRQLLSTFNSKKRTKLKEQEVIFIKKFEILRLSLDSLDSVIEKVLDIEEMFRNNFDYEFIDGADRDLIRYIMGETIGSYFEIREKL